MELIDINNDLTSNNSIKYNLKTDNYLENLEICKEPNLDIIPRHVIKKSLNKSKLMYKNRFI